MPGKPKKKQTSLTPAQHTKVRQQLSEIMKKINAGQPNLVAATITQLIKKYPTLPELNHVASGYYAQIGLSDQAMYYATRAADLDPSVPEYHHAVGVFLVQAGKHQQGIDSLLRALELNPDFHQAISVLGVCYMQTGQIEKSREMFDRSIELFPDDFEPRMNRALLESDIANAHDAVERMRSTIERFPDNPVLHDSLAMFSCYDDQLTPAEVFDIHKAFGQCIQSQVRVPRSYPNTPDPSRRIRIGFLSSDFKTHSISYFLEPIFEHIDHNRFELCVYATSTYADEMTHRLKSHADLWRNCTQGVFETHKQIIKDRVDVLVELNGHFASNSLPIFAAKPAPVSITMIGYANTTGLETIDARIVDATTDPEPQADQWATEQLVRLENCFLCYRPPIDSPPVAEPDQTKPFTFGSFNDLRKISPSTLRVWADILKANPHTRLLLKTSRFAEPEVCQIFLDRFHDLGINPDRITLLGRTKTTKDHLDLYNTIDCSLDTFPYTGTTTTCESLVMGVPTITLLGDTHAGRVSASILNVIGRDDLVAGSEQTYKDLATKLVDAGKPSLKDRKELKAKLIDSPLTDEPGYTKKFETAVASLWSSWCATQSSNAPKSGGTT